MTAPDWFDPPAKESENEPDPEGPYGAGGGSGDGFNGVRNCFGWESEMRLSDSLSRFQGNVGLHPQLRTWEAPPANV